jgi:hypothetical protein
MKHKRVLFGLLAAVAAMMFLFCGDSVVTTGNGSETPGTTPGTDGGETVLDENAFVLTNTSKGISVANRAKYVGKKTAQVASDINQALKIIQDYAPANAAISIQYGSGGGNTLNLGTTVGVFDENWGNAVASIKFAGTANGTFDFKNLTVTLSGKIAGNVTVIIDPTNTYTASIGAIVPTGKVVDPDGKTVEVKNDGTVVVPPTTGPASTVPVLSKVSFTWTGDQKATAAFEISVNSNVWFYSPLGGSLGTTTGTGANEVTTFDADDAATIKLFGEKINGNTPTKEIDEEIEYKVGWKVYALIENSQDAKGFVVKLFENPVGILLAASPTGRSNTDASFELSVNTTGNYAVYSLVRPVAANNPGLSAEAIIGNEKADSVWWTVGLNDINQTTGLAKKTVKVTMANSGTQEVLFVLIDRFNISKVSNVEPLTLVADNAAPTITQENVSGNLKIVRFNTVSGVTQTTPNSVRVKITLNEVGTVFWKFSTTPLTTSADVKGSPDGAGVYANAVDFPSGQLTNELVLNTGNGAGTLYLVAEDEVPNLTANSAISSYTVNATADFTPTFSASVEWVPGSLTAAGSATAKITLSNSWAAGTGPSLAEGWYFIDAQDDPKIDVSGGDAFDFDALKALENDGALKFTGWPSGGVLPSATLSNITEGYKVYVALKSSVQQWGGGESTIPSDNSGDALTDGVELTQFVTTPPAFVTSKDPTFVSRWGNDVSFTLTSDVAADVYWKVLATAPTENPLYAVLTDPDNGWGKLGKTTAGEDYPGPLTLSTTADGTVYIVLVSSSGVTSEDVKSFPVPRAPAAVSIVGKYVKTDGTDLDLVGDPSAGTPVLPDEENDIDHVKITATFGAATTASIYILADADYNADDTGLDGFTTSSLKVEITTPGTTGSADDSGQHDNSAAKYWFVVQEPGSAESYSLPQSFTVPVIEFGD